MFAATCLSLLLIAILVSSTLVQTTTITDSPLLVETIPNDQTPQLSVSGCVNCISCSGQICLQCIPGWYIIGTTGLCNKCGDDCQRCEDYQEGCVACKSQDYLYVRGGIGLCYPCANGCLKCEDNVGCVQCPSGYYIYNDTMTGDDCDNCPKDCQTCSDRTTCQECKNGYKMVDGTCKSGVILSVSIYLALLFVCIVSLL